MKVVSLGTERHKMPVELEIQIHNEQHGGVCETLWKPSDLLLNTFSTSHKVKFPVLLHPFCWIDFGH